MRNQVELQLFELIQINIIHFCKALYLFKQVLNYGVLIKSFFLVEKLPPACTIPLTKMKACHVFSRENCFLLMHNAARIVEHLPVLKTTVCALSCSVLMPGLDTVYHIDLQQKVHAVVTIRYNLKHLNSLLKVQIWIWV